MIKTMVYTLEDEDKDIIGVIDNLGEIPCMLDNYFGDHKVTEVRTIQDSGLECSISIECDSLEHVVTVRDFRLNTV